MQAEISKLHCKTETAKLSLPSHSEYCITVQAAANQNIEYGLEQTKANLPDATVLSQFVFAGTEHYKQFEKTQNCPSVWLQGDACTDGNFYSIQTIAISGLNPKPISFNNKNIGYIYEDEYATYCRLNGVIPHDVTASRTEQTRSAFEVINTILKDNNFKFTDTIRTWIYLDDLLEWYDEFNVVRTQFFNETGIFDCMVPASTGIGAGNQFGAAIMMDILAVKPKNNQLIIQDVISPLQYPALDYKSSFSRAVEIKYPTHKNLLISGTASIDTNGATAHLDDPEKQIRLTMKVVHAILKSRDMHWEDLFRGIAYFKDMDYLPIYNKVASELEIKNFPLAISHADVCRHDLLFEIEVDAVKTL